MTGWNRPWTGLFKRKKAQYPEGMSKPVNLNRVRKEKARADKRAKADQNAVKFGRSKAEKARDKAEQDNAITRLDAHKRETE